MTVLRFGIKQEAVVEGNGNGKRKRRKRIIIWSSIAAGVLALVVTGVVIASSTGTKIDPSKLAKVEKGDLAKSVVATGKIEPITKVEIKSKASGIVKKLYVDYGDKVKKGQTLAELDKEEIQARVAQARANLKQLEEQLGYTTIESPIDGIILSRDVEIGDAVSSILVLGSSATLVMTLGDTSEVYVKGKVDESDIGKVYLGQPARIKVESFKEKTFNGKVTKISPMGVEKDNVTTFEVRVSINNPGGELKAEMTANAEIILEEHKNVLQIPEGAIIYDKDKKASVEVPDPHAKDGKRKLAINIGISNGAKTEVLGGLKENDQVVLQ